MCYGDHTSDSFNDELLISQSEKGLPSVDPRSIKVEGWFGVRKFARVSKRNYSKLISGFHLSFASVFLLNPKGQKISRTWQLLRLKSKIYINSVEFSVVVITDGYDVRFG